MEEFIQWTNNTFQGLWKPQQCHIIQTWLLLPKMSSLVVVLHRPLGALYLAWGLRLRCRSTRERERESKAVNSQGSPTTEPVTRTVETYFPILKTVKSSWSITMLHYIVQNNGIRGLPRFLTTAPIWSAFLPLFFPLFSCLISLLLSLCDKNVLQNVLVDKHFYHMCSDLFQKNPVGEGKWVGYKTAHTQKQQPDGHLRLMALFYFCVCLKLPMKEWK